jgi:hypothetical protein
MVHSLPTFFLIIYRCYFLINKPLFLIKVNIVRNNIKNIPVLPPPDSEALLSTGRGVTTAATSSLSVSVIVKLPVVTSIPAPSKITSNEVVPDSSLESSII